MRQFRFASVLLTVGATVVFATPSWALVHLQLHGGTYGGSHARGGMHMMMMPKPSMRGGQWGGGRMGGCCNSPISGGGHMMWYGGKPPLGWHPKGMHFYGMGGNASKYGGWGGGYRYGSGGSYGSSYPPAGMHPMGMHYYGMGGGSLAAKYGHLEHQYGTPISASWGQYGSPPPSNGWGMSNGSHGAKPPASSGHGYGVRVSYKVKVVYRYSVKFRSGYKQGGAGTWSSSSPPSSQPGAY